MPEYNSLFVVLAVQTKNSRWRNSFVGGCKICLEALYGIPLDSDPKFFI